MTAYLLEHALLPDGVASGVRIEVADGVIRDVLVSRPGDMSAVVTADKSPIPGRPGNQAPPPSSPA